MSEHVEAPEEGIPPVAAESNAAVDAVAEISTPATPPDAQQSTTAVGPVATVDDNAIAVPADEVGTVESVEDTIEASIAAERGVILPDSGERNAAENRSEGGEGGEGRGGRQRRRGGSGGGGGGKRPQADLSALTPGSELKGTVRSIQTYGAFVDIGFDRDGLVHISELKDGFVEKVEDVVKPGDEVTVRIKEVDQERGRISLTMRSQDPQDRGRSGGTGGAGAGRGGRGRQAEAGQGQGGEAPAAADEEGKPRRTRLKDLNEGQELAGTVTSIVDFGAFVDIGATTDGLVHISEMSDDRVNKVTDVLQEGQEVKVRVLQVDRKRNRISLTMREQVRYEMGDDEASDDEPMPTLFEAAFRRASERAEKKGKQRQERSDKNQRELDDIIRRTLDQHKPG